MSKANHCRKTSPSDLPDDPWALVAPLIPPPQAGPRGGRPRQGERRAVLNTLLSLHRSGGPWAMLPHDLLPTRTGYDDCSPWRDDGPWSKMGTALRAQTRVAAGRAPICARISCKS